MFVTAVAALLLLPHGTMARQDQAPELRFQGLGTHKRVIKTASNDAQRYFDQGLNFLFAFNHDEALRAFKHAVKLDPKCAMAWWGIAMANGPHINNPYVDEAHESEGWEASRRANVRSMGSSPADRALIEAVTTRFGASATNRPGRDKAYAAAMRKVWKRFPRDADVGALFAEAMMDLRPWDLWKADGSSQPGTKEIVATLERVLKLNPKHPLANHLYIHAVEASPHPEKAVAAANMLRDLQPGLGHMVHMPSHVDVRTGQWKEAIVANEKAIAADAAYRAKRPNQNFYRFYMAHNHHMLALAAMMVGQKAKALSAIDAMMSRFPAEWLKENAPYVDGYMAMPLEVRIRFGMWNEVLDVPEFPEYFPVARTLRHAARGVAFAASGRPEDARAEQSLFLAARRAVSKDAPFGNNSASLIMIIAEHHLNGEILVSEGKIDQAIAALREAAAHEDRIRYNEPPDWIQPVRHTLGAVLLKAGRFKEAEAVYRSDLRRLPLNGWSTYGLSEALAGLGKHDMAKTMKARFNRIWAGADTKITSSCLCVPGKS